MTNMENGEFIINKSSVEHYRNLLDDINTRKVQSSLGSVYDYGIGDAIYNVYRKKSWFRRLIDWIKNVRIVCK